MTKNIIGLFMDKLLDFPLWVKQIIYLRLYKNLALSLSDDFLEVGEENLFHVYIPVVSFVGKTEAAEKKAGLEPNTYTFLENAIDGQNILEISMNNFWTMEETAKIYIFCLEQNYLKTPESKQILAMGEFIAGKLRTGEYFKHIGKIDVDQLEQIIITQREFAQKGTPKKMVEVMIHLGLVSEKDTTSLLIIKEEAKKRFILNSAILPKCESVSTDLKAYQEQIAKLTEQNTQLKTQLSKLLALVKKNG